MTNYTIIVVFYLATLSLISGYLGWKGVWKNWKKWKKQRQVKKDFYVNNRKIEALEAGVEFEVLPEVEEFDWMKEDNFNPEEEDRNAWRNDYP